MQRLKLALVFALVGTALTGGVVYATHLFPPQLPPNSAAVGFLVSNNCIQDIPVEALARAAKPNGSRIFVQHAIFAAGQTTGWHTHPGPVVVTIIAGSLTLESPQGSMCESSTFSAGTGFVDRGFGHIHRATAGATGAEFYATYILPPDSHAVREPVAGSLPTPEQCQ